VRRLNFWPCADHCRDLSRWEGFTIVVEPPLTRKPVDLLKPDTIVNLMVKDSDRRSASVGILFLLLLTLLKRKKEMTKQTKKDVIAYRKTCPAKGTGLSHYILMDKKAK
jgi:modified peptide precursor CbpA